MIDFYKLIGEGKFLLGGLENGSNSDMSPFVCLLAGLVIALDAEVVFEIGTGTLNSGRAFLFGLEKTGGLLYSCDPAVKRFNLNHPNLFYIQEASQEVIKTWNKNIDIFLIDGDHSYEQVKFDFLNFSPFVRKGGLIIFHDTNYDSILGPVCVVKEIEILQKLSFPKIPGLTIFQK